MTYPWIQEGQRIFRIVVVIQWLISLFIAWLNSEWLAPFLLGLPIAIVPLILSFTSPGSRISRHAFGIGVQLMTALHIHQAYGLIEMHFQIFVLLAILAYFRDWMVIVSSTVVVAVHHIAFFVLQSNGAPVFVFEEGHVYFSILVIHALFAITEAAVLVYMCRQSLAESKASMVISASVDKILQDDKFDLRVQLNSDNPRLHAFAELIKAFQNVISEFNSECEQILAVSKRVSNSSTALEKTASTSTAAAENISEDIEELNDSIAEVAEQAKSANQYADDARHKTEQTKNSTELSSKKVEALKTTLSTTSSTLNILSERCSAISDTMQSIKQVAEQTNLLALNAAIESARAGEHGRGFAVVADEVRNLAIKSHESAEEIEKITEELIATASTSVQQMGNCESMVEQAVEASKDSASQMQAVTQNITSLTSNINKVAANAESQANFTDSIERLCEAMHKTLATNNQQVDETRAESRELDVLCAKLQRQLERFVV